MQTETAAFVEVSSSKSTKLNRYSEAEQIHHCETWKKSGLSMNEYCRRSAIAISSLSKWVSEYKNKTSDSTSKEKIEERLITASHSMVEIILTSGLRLRMSKSSMAELLRLIKALESCN